MMAKNKLFFIVLLSCSLVACQKHSKLLELDNQMEQLKNKINSQQPKATPLVVPKPIPAVYQAEKWRDPFERPQTTQGAFNNATSLKNFPLAMINFIGIIEKDNVIWGILLTPDNHTYKIKVGDMVGNLNGKITRIDAKQMEIVETIMDDKNHITQRLVTLPLK